MTQETCLIGSVRWFASRLDVIFRRAWDIGLRGIRYELLDKVIAGRKSGSTYSCPITVNV